LYQPGRSRTPKPRCLGGGGGGLSGGGGPELLSRDGRKQLGEDMLRISMMCKRPRAFGGGCTESVDRGPATILVGFLGRFGLGASGGFSSDDNSQRRVSDGRGDLNKNESARRLKLLDLVLMSLRSSVTSVRELSRGFIGFGSAPYTFAWNPRRPSVCWAVATVRGK